MTIRNTAEMSPAEALLRAIGNQQSGGRPGGDIEEMEAQGQQQLCRQRSQLPTEGLAGVATKLGITVLRATDGDPLFSDVVLPDGWEIRPTDHPMWTHLVDATGTPRANIFYKAAFYDRRADIQEV